MANFLPATRRNGLIKPFSNTEVGLRRMTTQRLRAPLLWPLALAGLLFQAFGAQALAQSPAPVSAKPRVCLLPMSFQEEALMKAVERGIAAVYGFDVRRLPAQSLPESAFYPPRGRYRAERLLAHLREKVLPGTGCNWIVGLTTNDISTDKGKIPDWGIFGLGELPGRAAVVSVFRLRPSAKSPRHLALRTFKVVNHELGHLLGLDHCPSGVCMMRDAEGTIKSVDDDTGLLCPACQARLKQLMTITLPVVETLDLTKILGN